MEVTDEVTDVRLLIKRGYIESLEEEIYKYTI